MSSAIIALNINNLHEGSADWKLPDPSDNYKSLHTVEYRL